MNELRDLARDGPIAEFVDRLDGLPEHAASGVSLRIDEYWLAWFNWRSLHHYGPWSVLPATQRSLRKHSGARYDFDRLPDDWNEHCARKGLRIPGHPVSVVVILRGEAGEVIPDAWPRFVGYHPVVYEHRADAILEALSPSAEVTGVTTGTLGGYLWRASDGQHFGVSCAHVFGLQNAPGGSAVHATGVPFVGKVVESHFPSVSSGKCNNRLQPIATVSTVDVAITDLSGKPAFSVAHPSIGKVAGRTLIQDIGQGDLVTLVGAKGRALSGRVKECNIWKQIKFNGNSYCFGDLLVVEDATHHYLPSKFTKPGDSGAWVIGTGAGYPSWDAMHIAGDGSCSYCCYSENIMALLDPQLSMPP